MFNDTFIEVICMCFAIGAIGIGIYEITQKKIFGRADRTVKDPAMIGEFTLKEGMVYIGIGIAAVLMSAITIWNILPFIPFYWIFLAVVIAGVVVDAILAKKYLK